MPDNDGNGFMDTCRRWFGFIRDTPPTIRRDAAKTGVIAWLWGNRGDLWGRVRFQAGEAWDREEREQIVEFAQGERARAEATWATLVLWMIISAGVILGAGVLNEIHKAWLDSNGSAPVDEPILMAIAGIALVFQTVFMAFYPLGLIIRWDVYTRLANLVGDTVVSIKNAVWDALPGFLRTEIQRDMPTLDANGRSPAGTPEHAAGIQHAVERGRWIAWGALFWALNAGITAATFGLYRNPFAYALYLVCAVAILAYVQARRPKSEFLWRSAFVGVSLTVFLLAGYANGITRNAALNAVHPGIVMHFDRAAAIENEAIERRVADERAALGQLIRNGADPDSAPVKEKRDLIARLLRTPNLDPEKKVAATPAALAAPAATTATSVTATTVISTPSPVDTSSGASSRGAPQLHGLPAESKRKIAEHLRAALAVYN
jgi:hypothetical protein